MKQRVSNEIQEVMDAVHYRPCVSLIMPFDPKMSIKSEVLHSLKLAADKVQRKLTGMYPEDTSLLVMQKLRKLISELNLNTHKKSIAIYVSPVFERVLYLDIPVEERIMVDNSFEIRDLVYAKKQLHSYLVLLLSYSQSQLYLGDANSFVNIVSNPVRSIEADINDAPERVANFSDLSERKEILMDKFLHHIDRSLDIILKSYSLPLFVLGTKKITGHFKNMTHHSASIIQYVHGNYENATLTELKEILEPYIMEWKDVSNKDLLNHLSDAYGKGKLVTGMKEVWRGAMSNKGRLLIVEKDFTYPAIQGSTKEVISKATEIVNKFSYIKDAVDQAIEAVLESGGDVEFVDKGMLENYNHIALIQHY